MLARSFLLSLVASAVLCSSVEAQEPGPQSVETRDPRGSLTAEILGGGAASVVSFGLGYGLGCAFARFAARLAGGSPETCLSASYVAGGAAVGLAIAVGLVPFAVAAAGNAPRGSGDYRVGVLAALITVVLTAPLMALAIDKEERLGVPAFLLENAAIVTATIVFYRWSCVPTEPIFAIAPTADGVNATIRLRL